jgi:hypothetical protein
VKGLINGKLINAAHDCSDGGLFVTLSEMSFPRGLGFDIVSDSEVREDAFLFGESQGRVIVTLPEDKEEDFIEFMVSTGVNFTLLGHVTKGKFVVDEDHYGFCNEIKDIYENGPKNDDPNSLILAEHFETLRQEELELKQKQNYAEIVAADFTEDAQASLRRIEQAVQDGCLDTELWFTNNLFKCVSRQFSRVVAVNSPEPWIPFAKLVSNKITEINIRDFDQHPSQPFICELRTQCHKVEHMLSVSF